jgi:hypothetical protein
MTLVCLKNRLHIAPSQFLLKFYFSGSNKQISPTATPPEHRQRTFEAEDADRSQEPGQALPHQHGRGRSQVEVHYPRRSIHPSVK